jgi:ADP-ribosylglycohydrolase
MFQFLKNLTSKEKYTKKELLQKVWAGAILGDMLGRTREGIITTKESGKTLLDTILSEAQWKWTDDSIIVSAINCALLENQAQPDYKKWLLYWGRKYPNVGYGPNFYLWTQSHSQVLEMGQHSED